MKFLEEYGVKKINFFFELIKKKNPTKEFIKAKDLFNSSHLYKMTGIAFLIGAILTFPVIWLELEMKVFSSDHIIWENILVYVISLIVLVGFEFYLLFLLGFYSIAYHLYHLRGTEEFCQQEISDRSFMLTYSRTIMELPEPKISDDKYNIDHHELSNKDIVLISAAYKAKVVVSNIVLKLIARKLLARTSFRVYSPYVATVGTGAWDAVVFYKSIKHSHHKVMAKYCIDYLLKHKYIFIMEDRNIKAILARYYLYSEYNNNFDHMLGLIKNDKNFNFKKEDFLATDVFSKASKELVVMWFAFKSTWKNKKEKKIIKNLQIENEVRNIRKALFSGDSKTLINFMNGLT